MEAELCTSKKEESDSKRRGASRRSEERQDTVSDVGICARDAAAPAESPGRSAGWGFEQDAVIAAAAERSSGHPCSFRVIGNAPIRRPPHAGRRQALELQGHRGATARPTRTV